MAHITVEMTGNDETGCDMAYSINAAPFILWLPMHVTNCINSAHRIYSFFYQYTCISLRCMSLEQYINFPVLFWLDQTTRNTCV